MGGTLLALFSEGFLAFLSPCVLPLVPLYLSYLSNGAKQEDAEGNLKYKQSVVFLMTLCFVAGISCIYLFLGASLYFLQDFFNKYQEVVGIIGGLILIFFALSQFGLFSFNKQWQLNYKFEKFGYLQAFLFGFIFSFAWTPCLGPMLSSAVIVASQNSAFSFLYLGIYYLGFVLPFIFLGIFTSLGLNLINKYKNVVKYSLKIAAVIILIFGIKMIYDNAQTVATLKANKNNVVADNETIAYTQRTYTDYQGNKVELTNGEGKLIYLNFIATWCTYCKGEIPAYQSFGESNDDVIIYYVMSPDMNGEEVEKIGDFILENNVKAPIIVDSDNYLFYNFGVSGMPTLYVLDSDGYALGYISGQLDEAYFNNIHQTALQRRAER